MYEEGYMAQNVSLWNEIYTEILVLFEVKRVNECDHKVTIMMRKINGTKPSILFSGKTRDLIIHR